MNTDSIISAITSVGFPIVMCAALFWYMIRQNAQHEEESKGMRDAIQELRIAIVKLTDKLGGNNNEN